MNEHDDEDFDLPFLNFLSFSVYWSIRGVGALVAILMMAPVLIGMAAFYPVQVNSMLGRIEAWLEEQPERAKADLMRLARPVEKIDEEAHR